MIPPIPTRVLTVGGKTGPTDKAEIDRLTTEFLKTYGESPYGMTIMYEALDRVCEMLAPAAGKGCQSPTDWVRRLILSLTSDPFDQDGTPQRLHGGVIVQIGPAYTYWCGV